MQTAFYRILRPLIARYGDFNAQLCAIIERFELEPETYQELCKALDEPTAMTETDVPPILEAIAAELHTNTWFATSCRDELVRTSGGTRPGSPCADLIFNFLFMKVVHRIRRELFSEELLIELEWTGDKSLFPEVQHNAQDLLLFETIWADDLAILTASADGETIIPKSQKIMATLVDGCMKYGLKPNFAKGKTEILFCIRGKNSVKTRRQIFEQKTPAIDVPSKMIPDCRVLITTRYVHLGGQLTVAANDQAALFARFGQSRAVFDRFRRKLFQSCDVSLETRTRLMEPFVLSILQFGLGTLTILKPADYTAANRRLMLMYKALLKPLFPRDTILTMSYEEVIARTQLPSFDILFHINRLRHFRQILSTGPPILWALIEYENEWIVACRRSFGWLFQQLRTTIILPDPLHRWEAWKDLIMHEPGKWRGLLKRAQKHAIYQIGKKWACKHWHATIMELAADRGRGPMESWVPNASQAFPHMSTMPETFWDKVCLVSTHVSKASTSWLPQTICQWLDMQTMH